MFDLHGARALITGAGGIHGIGVAIAAALARQGAVVHLTGLNPRVHQRAAEIPGASSSTADLTDAGAAGRMVDQAVSALGGLDILVNNAGMTAVDKPGESGDATAEQSWSANIARNLDSAFWVTRAALPHLRMSDRGRIIMVASVTGAVMAMRGEVGYAAAKAGMVGLTRALAVDEARYAVTVNALAPGWIETGSQTETEAEQGRRTPLGRSGTPDEVASAAVWLASREAGYVTGQVIVIDGGNAVAEERG